MSTLGVATTASWALTGAFGCWLSTRAQWQRTQHNQPFMPDECYPGASGPIYLSEGNVMTAVSDLAALRASIDEIRHLSPTPAAPLLPPDCSLLALAVEMGSCLLVRRAGTWSVWVAQRDRATHRPATVWQSTLLTQAPAMPTGGERSTFQRTLLDAAQAVEALDVRVWSGSISGGGAHSDGAGDSVRESATAAQNATVARRRANGTPGLPPLPQQVPAALRSDLVRVQSVRDGLHDALAALASGQTTASVRRIAAVTEHIGVLSELQQAARAYADSLWTTAFSSCR